MYSPFFDSRGNSLDITQVKYSNLEQLKDCEEGYHVEFKSIFAEGGKNHLPKTIAAFANCEGGWLIVGIDNETRELKPIDRCDYSQKVGKIVTRVSPKPEFETKFISMPEDRTKGILLIYIYEGKNAPYVFDGVVFLRCGSNKEPLIKTAERGNIEYLVRRTQAYNSEIDSFFNRDFLFVYSNTKVHAGIPLATIYLKNISDKIDKTLNRYTNRSKLISFVYEKWPQFKHHQFSMDSILFFFEQIYPGTNKATFVLEIFYDWSCKIYVPLGTLEISKQKDIIDFYREFGMEGTATFKIVDGSASCNALMFCLSVFDSVAKRYKLKEKNYAFATEIENAGAVIMCFEGNRYRNYIKKYGLPYATKERNKSKIIYLKNNAIVKFEDLVPVIVKDFVGPAFGFESDEILKILDDDNLKYTYVSN